MTDLVSVAEDVGVSVASGLEREQTRKTYTSGNLSECSWEDCKCAQCMQVGLVELVQSTALGICMKNMPLLWACSVSSAGGQV